MVNGQTFFKSSLLSEDESDSMDEQDDDEDSSFEPESDSEPSVSEPDVDSSSTCSCF